MNPKRTTLLRPGKQGGPVEFAVDDEGGDGAEWRLGEDRATAEKSYAVIDDNGGVEFRHTELFGGSARKCAMTSRLRRLTICRLLVLMPLRFLTRSHAGKAKSVPKATDGQVVSSIDRC
jgi:hypothetical protein